MTFRPRSGRKNYITQRRGRYYYRRMIPANAQHLFGSKKVWMIPIDGETDTEREASAQELAAKHNRQIKMAQPADITPPADAVAMLIDLTPDNLPPDAPPPPPARFLRNGEVQEVYKFAVTDDPAQRRAAEANGFFVVSQAEAKAQLEFQAQLAAFEGAQTEEQAEIADLKAERAAREIEDTSRVSGETVLSILPRWRAHKKQAATTWKKHEQYAREFSELFGEPALSAVTKRHVVEYVEHAQTLTYRKKPLSPTSITKRLDSIRALLAFAVEVDEIDTNPATGVKSPKDERPKTARSWKSFDKKEVKAMLTQASDLWTNRRHKHPSRGADLTTALHCLIWTGARPEEICQLRRGDVDLSDKVIRITNDATEDDARAPLVKNERSIRVVPIHSKLLPVLSEHVRASNHALLFPSFEPIPTPAEIEEQKETGVLEIKGRYARPISREWTDNLRSLIAPNEPRKVLYSLRHSWAAESRRTGMPEHVRNAIMGHADDNPHAGRYGGDAEWIEEKRLHLEKMSCV